MIQALQDWAMVLSGLAVFGSLCEVILPEGSVSKYIRLGLGMLLVLSLLSPLGSLFRGNWAEEKLVSQHRYRDAEQMEAQQREEVLGIYEENLNQAILSAIQEQIPEFLGTIECRISDEEERFGEIERIQILPENKEVTPVQLQRVVRENFGIKPEQITITF